MKRHAYMRWTFDLGSASEMNATRMGIGRVTEEKKTVSYINHCVFQCV